MKIQENVVGRVSYPPYNPTPVRRYYLHRKLRQKEQHIRLDARQRMMYIHHENCEEYAQHKYVALLLNIGYGLQLEIA
jgi:hypothetical protein